MVQNIDDVLQRGAILSELENKSANLTEMSRKYKKDAETLNATSLAVIAGSYLLLYTNFKIKSLRKYWVQNFLRLERCTVKTKFFGFSALPCF